MQYCGKCENAGIFWFFFSSFWFGERQNDSDFENARIFAWFIYETHVFVFKSLSAITVTNVAWGYRRYSDIVRNKRGKCENKWALKGFGFSSFFSVSIITMYTGCVDLCTKNNRECWMTMFNEKLAFYTCHLCLSVGVFLFRSLVEFLANMKIKRI